MTSKRVGGAYVSNERWTYADLAGMCGTTTVAGNNGVITKDDESDRCVWNPAAPPDRSPAAQRGG